MGTTLLLLLDSLGESPSGMESKDCPLHRRWTRLTAADSVALDGEGHVQSLERSAADRAVCFLDGKMNGLNDKLV